MSKDLPVLFQRIMPPARNASHGNRRVIHTSRKPIMKTLVEEVFESGQHRGSKPSKPVSFGKPAGLAGFADAFSRALDEAAADGWVWNGGVEVSLPDGTTFTVSETSTQHSA